MSLLIHSLPNYHSLVYLLAFWWGIEWIRFVVDYLWFGYNNTKDGERFVRGYNAQAIFEEKVKKLPKDIKRRIKYFRPYVQMQRTNCIHLYPIYSKTDKDGEREYYAKLLSDNINLSNNISQVSKFEYIVQYYYHSKLFMLLYIPVT